jgi:hypothetical protein
VGQGQGALRGGHLAHVGLKRPVYADALPHAELCMLVASAAKYGHKILKIDIKDGSASEGQALWEMQGNDDRA